MSKILMLLFNPYSPDPRVKKEADTLVKAGHEITIMAWKRKSKATIKKESEYKVIPVGPPLKDNFFDGNIGTQIFGKFLSMMLYYLNILKKTKHMNFDVVHAHDLDTLPLGVIISKLHNVPLVYDSHEIYGQMLAKKIPQVCIYGINHAEKLLIKNVDTLITVTDYHVSHFQKMGVRKVFRVSNFKDIIDVEYKTAGNNELNLLYIGGLIKARFLLEAIEVCNSIEGVRLIIYGDGELFDDILQASKKGQYKNVEALGRLPMNLVYDETKKADVVLCMLDPGNFNNRVGPPNKLFEAMVCGRPVIATEGTYSGSVVREEDIGIVSEFNKNAFEKAVRFLRDNPDTVKRLGRNSLKSALNTYNWKEEERTLLAVYDGGSKK
jgi:glycosyltransferase involved in cell wall biosynthesis